MNNKKKMPLQAMFLNLDGVANTHRVDLSEGQRSDMYDPIVINFLERVCEENPDLFIVITSKDRKCCEDVFAFQDKMVQNGGGVIADKLFDQELWATTNICMDCKALEIDDWFLKFGNDYLSHSFYISNYVIIDSESLGSLSMHDKHLVKVEDKHDGMRSKDFRAVVNILEKKG